MNKICVCETQIPPCGNKDKIGFFLVKGHGKVTRSLTLFSFERVPLIELYEVTISYGSKDMAKFKVLHL